MKFKTAMHLLVAATIAFGVTSCGSDKNTTNSGTVANTALTYNNGNPGQGAITKDEFYNQVAANQFDKGSSVGLYAFKRNSSSSSSFDFNFDFCFNNCADQQQERFQDSVDGYVWRHLQDSESIRRNFQEQGISFSGPNSDGQFGSTLSGLREGLLTIIRNGTSAQKCTQSYQGQSNSTYLSFSNGNQVPVLLPASTTCQRWESASTVSSGFGNTNYTQQRSKLFKFYYSGKTYIIDLTQPMILNPTAVY